MSCALLWARLLPRLWAEDGLDGALTRPEDLSGATRGALLAEVQVQGLAGLFLADWVLPTLDHRAQGRALGDMPPPLTDRDGWMGWGEGGMAMLSVASTSR